MDILIIILLFIVGCHATNNTTSIDDDCKTFLSEKSNGFFRRVFWAQHHGEFLCTNSSPMSELFWIVDKICKKEDCFNVEQRPINRIFAEEEATCQEKSCFEVVITTPPIIFNFGFAIFAFLVLATLLMANKLTIKKNISLRRTRRSRELSTLGMDEHNNEDEEDETDLNYPKKF